MNEKGMIVKTPWHFQEFEHLIGIDSTIMSAFEENQGDFILN